MILVKCRGHFSLQYLHLSTPTVKRLQTQLVTCQIRVYLIIHRTQDTHRTYPAKPTRPIPVNTEQHLPVCI